MSGEGLLLDPGQGKRLPLGGSEVLIKASADQAESASVFEFTVGPGFDVGAHRHENLEEFFYILSGVLDLRVGDVTKPCKAGSFMLVPRRVVHQFINRAMEPAKLLVFVTPSGHERYFEGLAEILSQSGGDRGLLIADLRARFDTEEVTPLDESR